MTGADCDQTPHIPSYGSGTLGDLLPSIGAHLGLGGSDVLDLPDVARYVVLMVDGLGWDLLGTYGRDAGLPGEGEARVAPIDVGAPTTTVTSLASLGTGLTPGQHGMVGHTFRRDGQPFAPLRPEPGVDGRDVQPGMTWFERFAKVRTWTSVVAPAIFAGSLFTGAAQRGARFVGQADEADAREIVRLTALAAASGETSVTYAYTRVLDQQGHAEGVASAPWLSALRFVAGLIGQLRAELPRGTALIVTGDHGMVNVTNTSRIVVEQVPALQEGVAFVAGEARFRHVYVQPGRDGDVAGRWAAHLGDDAWVRTRDEAIAEGWFGAVSPRMAERIGDVVVAARGMCGVFTLAHPRELKLRGMHGSLTRAEMQVPLMVL